MTPRAKPTGKTVNPACTGNFQCLAATGAGRNTLPRIAAATGFTGRFGIRKQQVDAGAVTVHRDVIINTDLGS